MDTATVLLNTNADLQARDELKQTALFETLCTTDRNGLSLLLMHGMNISACDHMGDSALHRAERKRAVKHASLLIKTSRFNVSNAEGMTHLCILRLDMSSME